MATIVNTPGTEGGSAAVLIVGLVITAVLVVLFFIYGLPALQNMSQASATPTTIKVELPTPTPEPSPVPTPAPVTTP